MRRNQHRIHGQQDFIDACEEMGGEHFQPNEHADVCRNDNGDEIALIHDHEGFADRVEISEDGSADSVDWNSDLRELHHENNRRFILRDAEGNPGPGAGMPMYVDDAEVTFEKYGVYAERTQQL